MLDVNIHWGVSISISFFSSLQHLQVFPYLVLGVLLLLLGHFIFSAVFGVWVVTQVPINSFGFFYFWSLLFDEFRYWDFWGFVDLNREMFCLSYWLLRFSEMCLGWNIRCNIKFILYTDIHFFNFHFLCCRNLLKHRISFLSFPLQINLSILYSKFLGSWSFSQSFSNLLLMRLFQSLNIRLDFCMLSFECSYIFF